MQEVHHYHLAVAFDTKRDGCAFPFLSLILENNDDEQEHNSHNHNDKSGGHAAKAVML